MNTDASIRVSFVPHQGRTLQEEPINATLSRTTRDVYISCQVYKSLPSYTHT